MQKLSLKTKFFIGTTVLLILFSAIIITFIKTVFSKHLTFELQKRGLSITKHLAEESPDFILTEDKPALNIEITNIRKAEKDIEYAYVIDYKGKILIHTFEKGFPKRLKEVNIVQQGKKYNIQPLITEKGLIFDIGVPVLQGRVGYVHIGISGEHIKRGITDIIRVLLIITGGSLFLGIIIAMIFANIITKPVSEIVSVAKEVGKGNFNCSVSIRTDDEIGQLGMVFNKMIKELEVHHNEAVTRESENQFRSWLENVRLVAVNLDIKGNVEYVNPFFLELTEYEQDEVISKNWFENFISLNQRQTVKNLFLESLNIKRSTIYLQSSLITRSGKEKIINWNNTLIQRQEGNITGILCIGEDITESLENEMKQKQSEKEIQRQYSIQTVLNSLRLSLENIPLEEVLKSSLDLILSIPWLSFESRGALFLVEDNKEVLTMKAQSKLAEPIQKACARVPFGRCLCGRAASSQQIQFANCLDERHETTYKGISSHGHYCVPIISKGRTIGVFNIYLREGHKWDKREEEFLQAVADAMAGIINHHRTEKAMTNLQEQLRQSQKIESIGKLAGGVAHDFNNLLTIIKGYSDPDFLGLKENDPLMENIQEIQKAAQRAENLTSQLLAFSRRQVMKMNVIDLNTILQGIDKMLQRIIGEDIELVTVLTKDLGKVKADPGQIEQVIMNLAINSRDAIPDGGKLTIETANVELDEFYSQTHIGTTKGSYVMLAVSDNGCGMSPEVKEQIFEPFFTTKEKGKGTGLGLSTVYGIVKQSNGNIWVYSEPGKGTTFKIYFPRVDEPIEAIKENDQKEIQRGKGTILIVEDEDGLRKLAAQVLKKNGYKVLEASNGGEALITYENYKEPVHLILTDVMMPKMTGKQLVERLHQMGNSFKVIYMSGYTDSVIALHGILEEGLNFVQKPFTPDTLLRKVYEVSNSTS